MQVQKVIALHYKPVPGSEALFAFQHQSFESASDLHARDMTS
jgi:hypothetical protein